MAAAHTAAETLDRPPGRAVRRAGPSAGQGRPPGIMAALPTSFNGAAASAPFLRAF